MDAIMARKINAGDVIVIRYEGPKGGPGMQEMLAPTSALIGQGSASRSASSPTAASRAARGEWSSVTSRPEAFVGGAIALVEEGDSITIDAHRLLIQLNVRTPSSPAPRVVAPPPPRHTRGLLAKYRRLVSTASIGAITDGGD
jgi:dihydroxy-acid dehydratase